MTSHIQPKASWEKYWEENCHCLEAYKDRGMVDPGCAYCNTFDEVKDAIAEAVEAEELKYLRRFEQKADEVRNKAILEERRRIVSRIEEVKEVLNKFKP